VKADVQPALGPAGVKPHVLASLMLPAPGPAYEADHTTAVPLAERVGLRTPTRDALDQLYERVLIIQQLRLWFEHAARSLPAEAKGAHKAAENRRLVVGQVDAILAECAGRHINRICKNDLVRHVELCSAAEDPNVGSGSINRVFEAYVRLILPRRMRRAQIAKKSTQFGH